eukprot:COSAG06_NODE_38537_length_422_cov_1.068111_1_plen_30_part_10
MIVVNLRVACLPMSHDNTLSTPALLQWVAG